MALERAFVLLKPDAVLRGLIGKIVSMFEEKGFKICALKMFQLTEKQLYELYPKLPGKDFHHQVRRVMLAAPCVAMALEGHEAVRAAFDLAGGHRNPEDNPAWSVRGKFALWTGSDLIHRADSPEDAASQIAAFFEPGELYAYRRLDEFLMSPEGWEKLVDLPPLDGRPG
jgi:nucleoside-diphosphate kinase